MVITKWGYCDFYSNYTEAIIYKKLSKGEYHVKLFDNYILVDYMLDNKIVLSFTDIMLDCNNLSTFSREILNQEYKFIDGKLISKSKKYLTKYIKPLLGEIYFKDNILTMDLETRTIHNKMEVFLINIYDGKEKFFFLFNRLRK